MQEQLSIYSLDKHFDMIAFSRLNFLMAEFWDTIYATSFGCQIFIFKYKKLQIHGWNVLNRSTQTNIVSGTYYCTHTGYIWDLFREFILLKRTLRLLCSKNACNIFLILVILPSIRSLSALMQTPLSPDNKCYLDILITS